jgi:LysM domain
MGSTAHAQGRLRHRERRRSQGCRVPPNRSAGIRLTRRGRVVLIGTVAVALLGGLWLSAGRGALAGSKGDQAIPAPTSTSARESVIVGRRDTLWEIASRARPDVDPRITVRRIIDLNSLPDPIVHPGQRLLLPGS